jgi:hypothetical protein
MKSLRSSISLRSALTILISFAGVYYTLLYFILAVPRLLFPYEIEWFEGIVLDHVLRIVHGKPVFAAPSIEMVNLPYQPLYYFVTAGAMQIFGAGYFAGRFVSFFSVIVSSILIILIIRRETRSWWYAFIGSALFFAAYGVTGFFYEIARIDSLMLTCLIASVAMLLLRKNHFTLILSALFLALSFFVKQESVFYFLPVIIWLALSDKRRALILSFSLILFLSVGVLLFGLESGHWYFYFTFELPRTLSAAIRWDKTIGGVIVYTSSVFAASVIIMSSFWIMNWSTKKEKMHSSMGLLTLLVIAGCIQIGVQFGYPGTNKNILMPFVLFLSVTIPIMAWHVGHNSGLQVRNLVLVALLIQFGGLFYSFRNAPLVVFTRKDYQSGERFMKELRSLPGDVLLPEHGFISFQAGKKTFAHTYVVNEYRSIRDSISARLGNEWEDAFTAQKYTAIIVDKNPSGAYDSIPGYTYSHEMQLGPHSWENLPRYVFLPKK